VRRFVIQFGDSFAHGRPLEFDAVGIVGDAVYASGLTVVDLSSRPIPLHEVVEAGHLVV
jgi:hypothetical protein